MAGLLEPLIGRAITDNRYRIAHPTAVVAAMLVLAVQRLRESAIGSRGRKDNNR